jgi:hypothetical protein
MQRRMVDTAQRTLASSEAIVQPGPGAAAYHISVDDHLVQVGEHDLDGRKINPCPHLASTEMHIWTI